MDIKSKIGILLLIVIILLILKIIATTILDIEETKENSGRLFDIVRLIVLDSKK